VFEATQSLEVKHLLGAGTKSRFAEFGILVNYKPVNQTIDHLIRDSI
jgi:hypothetical protein